LGSAKFQKKILFGGLAAMPQSIFPKKLKPPKPPNGMSCGLIVNTKKINV
jgi:hypothetical protein